MKHKLILLIIIFAGMVGSTARAQQEYYDLTEQYLRNADFSSSINYDASATGDVKNVVADVVGWTLSADSKRTLTVGATFQYGTQTTFYDVPIPAAGPDGDAQGGCLAMCAALKHEIAFCQKAKLPAGHYMMVVTYSNCNPAATTGQSCMGWWTSATQNTLSPRTDFPVGEWLTDTISFDLDDVSIGYLQVGIKSAGGLPTASAMLVVDRVRLLRDTPYGPQDDVSEPPVVVTDTRYARGATMAFGRIKIVQCDDDIVEKGFCWATHSQPTLADNYTTDYLENSGIIYTLKNLQPTTIYYMRGYAKSVYGKVGYGDVIKFCTLPMGNVTYWYNNGGDAAANGRVNSAATEACTIFNMLTSIVKHFNIGYSAGTPTADCYYDDTPWMNMGANSSYQRTGTIMHEMQHGMGVIPYTTQWAGSVMREGNGTGNWLGDRVSAFLDFWDNTSGSRLHGDTQHMWPYGINGAQEDHNNIADYYANAMIGQALGEDGLEHRYNTFAEPYYSLLQEDTVKYYLTPEDEKRGRFTAYLMATPTGTLRYVSMSSADALQNDSAAWYITFTPKNQHYQLRNAATGKYITYSGSMKTVSRTTPTAAEDFHLMPGRVNVSTGNGNRRGYWLIHPSTDTWTPASITAGNNNLVTASAFNIANSATQQRWLIVSAEELPTADPSGVSAPYIQQDSPLPVGSRRGVFSLDGRQLSTDRSSLKPGLYIIDGKKTIIR